MLVCVASKFLWKDQPATAFSMGDNSATGLGILSDLTHMCSTSGKFSEYGIMTIQQIREVTLPYLHYNFKMFHIISNSHEVM